MALSPSKINLYLHICGRRADGYHLLHSLMVPLAFGDILEIHPDSKLSLEVVGSPLAQEPVEQNLVMKAARALQAALNVSAGARMALNKHIPHAAGLGGGSSDAATALKLLLALWNKDLEEKWLLKIAESLGADVPFFLNPTGQYAEGIGEKLTPVAIPKFYVLLVNSGTLIPTAAIFAKGFARYSKPAPKPKEFSNLETLVMYLKNLSNDLTQNAITLAPEIAKIISQLENSSGCLLARMSGSGATCFGIFESAEACKKAAAKFPSYWTQVTPNL